MCGLSEIQIWLNILHFIWQPIYIILYVSLTQML